MKQIKLEFAQDIEDKHLELLKSKVTYMKGFVSWCVHIAVWGTRDHKIVLIT